MALMVQEKKNPAGKSDLRISCDSMSCIRFNGYNLSPAIAEHPNRNEALLMGSDEKSKLI